MNIVVLDGYTLNPGDLSWAELEKLGALTIHERTSRERLLEYSSEADILITNKTVINKKTIEALPKLKFISVLATGYNIVDIEVAASRKIPVSNVPAYSTDSVAQLVFAHILNFCRRVESYSQSVKKGDWGNQPDFTYSKFPQTELTKKKIAIVGYGNIGKKVKQLALAFGMDVIVVTRHKISDPDIKQLPLEEALAVSDFVSLSLPLTSESENIIDGKKLALMKKNAFLINTARGPLIDEDALYEVLKKGDIAGAALDVLVQEPPTNKSKLTSLPNITITPHIAWATKEARIRLLDVTVKNIASFIAGNPINVVN